MASRGEKWKFHAHPLVTNGHLQTVLGIYWPYKYQPYQAEHHLVPLDDGDKIVLHEDRPAKENEALPVVLLIHGLAGSYESTYMRRMVEKLNARGYHCFRMDMRGCGAGESEAKLPTHCGRWQDVAAALHYLAEACPDRDVEIIGFSMGGSQAINMLAEMGHMPIGNLRRTLAISPPLDLVQVERHFRSKLGTRYDKFFVKLLWQQNMRRWQLHPDTAPAQFPARPKRLRELDTIVTAPVGGYASADDYYLKASPAAKLSSIRQPVLILSSEDDPIVPIDPLFRNPLSTSIELVTTQRGGHLGFMARRNGDPDFRWLDWRIIDWLEQGIPSSALNTPHIHQWQSESQSV